MAKATVHTEPVVDKVVLELTHAEAQALINALGAMTTRTELHVGNGNTRTVGIYFALKKAGYEATRKFIGLAPRVGDAPYTGEDEGDDSL